MYLVFKYKKVFSAQLCIIYILYGQTIEVISNSLSFNENAYSSLKQFSNNISHKKDRIPQC